jgi:hypothetical protein
MRKEYDLRSLKVKRRGPMPVVPQKATQAATEEKPAKTPSGRPKRHR